MKLLEYHLGPKVSAFSTYRQGGVSRGSYSSFNANSFCGDQPGHVAQNRAIMAQHLQLNTRNIIIPHQTHDTRVCRIDADFLSLTDDERKQHLEGIDALITTEQGICLCVSTADCVPIVIYDDRGAVACIHAGWRGMYRHIITRAIQALNHIIGTDSPGSHRRAAIGPCITRASFEVGDEVYEAFAQAGFDMSQVACRPNGPTSKWHIDLVEAAMEECERNGIGRTSVEACRIDTFTHSDDFFSARKLGTQSGRILTGILLHANTEN